MLSGAPWAEDAELRGLLRDLSPRLNEGRYVYTTAADSVPEGDPEGVPEGVHPVVTVREDEGLTLVLPQEQADALGLPYTFVAAWITLQVPSALEAVGLTAVVSRVLAAAGISANIVAGFHRDHVFVPYPRAEDAMRALATLTNA